MKVIKQVHFKDTTKEKTIHSLNRINRMKAYKPLQSDIFISCFLVDKGHKNGPEIHCINKYGLIYIYNNDSKKFITALHPRPAQLKRYYRLLNIDIPLSIKRLASKCYKRNINSKLNNK